MEIITRALRDKLSRPQGRETFRRQVLNYSLLPLKWLRSKGTTDREYKGDDLVERSYNPQIEVIANRVEAALRALYPTESREEGQRAGVCGPSANLVKRASQVQNLEAHMYQNTDIQLAAGEYDLVHPSWHGFTVVRDSQDRAYIVDLTAMQFINPETQTVQRSTKKVVESRSMHVAESLRDHGYFLLDEQTLMDYLNLLTTRDEKSLRTVMVGLTPEKLLKMKEMDYDYNMEELDDWLKRGEK